MAAFLLHTNTMGDDGRLWLANQGKGPVSSGPSREAMESANQRASSSATRMFRSHGAHGGDAEFAAFQHTSANPSLMEQAWQSAGQPAPSAPQAPKLSVTPPPHSTSRDGANFFEALEAESGGVPGPEPESEPASLPAPATIQLDEEWRPPSPSQGARMSKEEYDMHVKLVRAQMDLDNEQPYRKADLSLPPPDDATLEEGVYAKTPEAALESVWDTQNARASRVTRFRETTAGALPTSAYTQVRGQAVVDSLRGWLVRGGYEDEVYGLPPLTAQTFGEATMDAPDEETQTRRATAIRRLDALYKHLSTGPPEKRGAAQMEEWLQQYGKGA